jgi:hypothetical protein
VDLDEQAVEVTRLSMMLKMLEGEHGIIPGRAVLPTLDHNVQCGNSLISGDVLKLQSFFKEEWIKTNPFDWNSCFRKIVVAERGFDVVIGNPPYVRIQTLPKDQVGFFSKSFVSATGNYDIYTLFVEQGLKLLKPGGVLGFILPHKFFQAAYGQGLRKLISDQNVLMEVVNFRDNQIFEQASTYTCLLFLQKNRESTFKYSEVAKLEDPEKQLQIIREHEEYRDDHIRIGKIPKKQITEKPWSFSFGEEAALIEKIKSIGLPLGEVTDRIFQGLKTSADKIYILDVIERKTKTIKVHSPHLDRDIELEPNLLKPLIKGGQMQRYLIDETEKVIIFPYRGLELLGSNYLKEGFPKTWEYLTECRKYLEDREDGKMKGSRWYAYIYPKSLDKFDFQKIITPDIAVSASYCYDSKDKYYFSGGAAGGYGILPKKDVHPKYLLALLNSRLVDWFHHRGSTRFRGGYFSYESRFIRDLPIRIIDFDNPKEKVLHDDLVKLVNVMLDLRRREQKAEGHELDQFKRQIEKTGHEINERVYELYGITEKERKLIEGV